MEEFLGNPSWLRLVLDILTVLVSVGFSIIIFLLRKISKANEEIIEVQKDLVAIEASTKAVGGFAGLVQLISTHIASAPDRQDIAEIHRRIDEIVSLVSEMKGELKGIKNITDTLYKTHLKS